MDFKDSERLIDSFKKRPLKSTVAIIILLLALAVITFLTSYFSEKGKRAAGLTKEGINVEQASKVLPLKLKETKPPSTISQHTKGNQAPIVNVSPGGKSLISYGSKSPPASPPPEKSTSVISVGQTGGITAQSVVINVKEESKRRTITPEQKMKLAQFLPPPASFQIAAACRLMDSESCSYAEELMEVFRGLRWQTGPINKSFLDDTRSDVVVAITEDVQIPVANRIMAALNKVGIKATNDPIREGSIGGVQTNTLYLIVGARKQTSNE
jgi:hypothetical protein